MPSTATTGDIARRRGRSRRSTSRRGRWRRGCWPTWAWRERGEMQRYLIVNADDFGQSRGVNAGIVEAHERGVVTSASLMVRWPAAAEAAACARSHPRLAVGLHLDLGEWECRDGTWVARY